MTTARGIVALALLVAGIAVVTSGCVLVPVGPGYRRAYAPPPRVVVPAPVVVVPRPYGYWW